jgi:hypothetical protein
MALVIWFLTGEQRLLRSIACEPQKNFFYLAHLATHGFLLSVEYNFAVLTNKFFTHRLERGQRSQLKRHRSEIDLTRNFSKQ